LFEQRLEEFVELMQAALDDLDPWQGFAAFLERALELQAADRGLRELVLGAPGGQERVTRLRAQLYPLGERLIQRARETGQLRADCEAQDTAILQLMLGLVIDATHDVEPELRRRYLAIILQGQRSILAMLASSCRSPVAGVRALSRWICSVLSSMTSAAVFSSTRETRLVSGMGAMSEPWASNQANATCAGVASSSDATARTS